jgi:non-homologous end joining protein Ku
VIALSLALGLVGLVLVLAARDVAIRWLAQRENTRALRAEVDAAVERAVAAAEGVRGELTGRLAKAEEDVAAIVERERQERLARIGGRTR